MYLYFRFLKIALFSRFRKPCDFFDESTVSFITWPTDLDVFCHMNNGRYLTLLDLARFDCLIRSGLTTILRQKKCFPVVTAETIQFKKSLKLFNRFTVKTKLLGWDEKSFYIEHIFVSKQKVCAVAIIRGQIVKTAGGTLSPLEFLSFAGHTDPSPELPEWILHWSQHQKEALIKADTEHSITT